MPRHRELPPLRVEGVTAMPYTCRVQGRAREGVGARGPRGRGRTGQKGILAQQAGGRGRGQARKPGPSGHGGGRRGGQENSRAAEEPGTKG